MQNKLSVFELQILKFEFCQIKLENNRYPCK